MRDVAKVLDRLDVYKDLECDGMTRIISGMFQRINIEHTVRYGEVLDTRSGKRCAPHFWIDLPDGRRIDYRLQKWLGKSSHIPNGVVFPTDWTEVVYVQKAVKMPGTNDVQVAEVLASMSGVNFMKMVLEMRGLPDDVAVDCYTV